jgi:NAD(P)-dependent dehydrogenase (short-subunit alcohol dehydrogenase family)
MQMSEKVVLITGATNGIGKVTALELAKQGYTVVIVGRNPTKTQATVSEIKLQSGSSTVDALIADLSSLAEIRRLADEFRQRYSRLDVLVNNAGAFYASRQESVNGYEMTFAVNHLAYFLLTNLLLDMLKASAPARIVNVSSDAHKGAKINFDDLQSTQNYGAQGFGAYGVSKLANILFTYELARQLEGTGITVNVLHPGLVATGFGTNNGGLMKLAMRFIHRFSISPEQGADTIIYLASSPEVEGVTGKYWVKRKAIRSTDVSYNEADQKRLWNVSAEMTGLAEPAGV